MNSTAYQIRSKIFSLASRPQITYPAFSCPHNFCPHHLYIPAILNYPPLFKCPKFLCCLISILGSPPQSYLWNTHQEPVPRDSSTGNSVSSFLLPCDSQSCFLPVCIAYLFHLSLRGWAPSQSLWWLLINTVTANMFNKCRLTMKQSIFFCFYYYYCYYYKP